MKILNHQEREALKKSGCKEDIDYSHWHRFLSCIYNEGDEVIKELLQPSLEEYIGWQKDFPGWSIGPMRPSHTAWKSRYYIIDLPMNKCFDYI